MGKRKIRKGSRKRSALSCAEAAAAKAAPIIIVLLALFTALAVLEKMDLEVTGFAIAEKDFTTAMNIDVTANATAMAAGEKTFAEMPVTLDAPPKSLSITGKLVGQGTAKAYLLISGQMYLIIDTSQLKREAAAQEGLLTITGRLVEEAQQEAQTITGALTDILADENATEPITANETQAENEKQQQNKTITAKLQYNSGTAFDPDDNGIETEKGAIDFTIAKSQFSWAADESKLCARWKIDSLDKGATTIVCNGAESCCMLAELKPKAESWSEPFQAFYGAYGGDVGYDNNVSAQVIYADYSMETAEATVEVAYGDWQSLPARFLPITEFRAACEETCDLPQMQPDEIQNATIAIELENADANTVMTLESVSYAAAVSVNTPPAYKAIPAIEAKKNSAEIINLSKYFTDADGDRLEFTASADSGNVIISIARNELAVVEPRRNFAGTATATFTASDGTEEARTTATIIVTGENTAPQLLKEIENRTMKENSTERIQLSSYFYDADNDTLTYEAYKMSGITITFSGDTATITPDRGFAGKRYSYLTAADKENRTAVSNIFTIEVTEERAEKEEKTTQGKAEIGKPVKWRRTIRLTRESNTTTHIPAAAAGITVKEEGFDIEEKVKVEEKGGARMLKEHLAAKKPGFGTAAVTAAEAEENVTLVIEENATEIEIEYETPAPAAAEKELGGNRKEVRISSDVHYENITAYATLAAEAPKDRIRLYRTTGGAREEAEIDSFTDANSNSLIDKISWTVPSLSEQTYEIVVNAETLTALAPTLSAYKPKEELTLAVLEQTGIDQYLSWQFTQLNDTAWKADFSFTEPMWSDLRQCLDTPLNTTCWQGFRSAYAPNSTLAELRTQLTNLANYPRQNLTDSIGFTDFTINRSTGQGSVIVQANVTGKRGALARLGWNSTTLGTSVATANGIGLPSQHPIVQTGDAAYHLFVQNGTQGGLRWLTSTTYGLNWTDMGQASSSGTMYADARLVNDSNEFYIVYSDTTAGAGAAKNVSFRQFKKAGSTWQLSDMGAEQAIALQNRTYAALELDADRIWVGFRTYNGTQYYSEVYYSDGFSAAPTWAPSTNFSENATAQANNAKVTMARWAGGNLSDSRVALFYWWQNSAAEQANLMAWRNDTSPLNEWVRRETVATSTNLGDYIVALGSLDDTVHYFAHNNARWNRKNSTGWVTSLTGLQQANFGSPTYANGVTYFFMVETATGYNITVRNSTRPYTTIPNVAGSRLFGNGTTISVVKTPVTAKDAIAYVWLSNYTNDQGYYDVWADAIDVAPPRHSGNSTNSTLTGMEILHSLKWNDYNLSTYIFSFDNGTGSFVNDTPAAFTSQFEAWSNVSKTVNSTYGAAIRWRVFANDSNNQWKDSGNFSYETTNTAPACTWKYPANGELHYSGNISLNASCSDQDGQALTVYWYVNGSFNKTTTTNTTINFTRGNYAANVSAYDGTNFSANATVTFDLSNNITLHSTTLSNWTGHTQNISAAFVDPDGAADIINYSITATSGSCNQLANTSSGNLRNFTFNCTGTALTETTVTITVNDTMRNSTTAVLTNTYPNYAPVQPNITTLPGAILGGTVTLTWNASSDTDGDSVTYFTMVNGSQRCYSADLNCTFTPTGEGVRLFNITAYDGYENSTVSNNSNFTYDSFLPTISSLNNNASTVTGNGGAVNWSATIADTVLLGNYTFEFNDTGSFVKNTTTPATGTSQAVWFTKTIATASRGQSVCGRIIVNDSAGNQRTSSNSCFDVANSPPAFVESLNSQNVAVPNTLILDVNCTDADSGDEVSYYDNTTLFAINGTTGNITHTPDETQGGAYSILITCGDGTANNTQPFTYTITEVLPPTYSGFATNATAATKRNDSANWTVAMQDGAALATWTFGFNDTGSFANDTTEAASGTSLLVSVNKTINSTRGKSVCAAYYFNDSSGNTNVTPYSCFTVANSAPRFLQDLVAQSVKSATTFELDVNCTDNDMDTITYYDNTTLFNINVETGLISDQPDESEVGTYTLNISCGDESLNTSQTFGYTITDSSNPTYAGLANNASTATGRNGSVNWSVTLSDAWGLYGYVLGVNDTGWFANETMRRISGTSAFVNFTKAVNGTNATRGKYVCGRFYFNDTSGNSNSTADSCFTSANSAPRFNQTPAAQTSNIGVLFNMQVTCTDVDFDTLTYYDNTTLFDINSSTGLIADTPTSDETGVYNVNITCGEDQYNASGTFSYTILDDIPPGYANLSNNASTATGRNGSARWVANFSDNKELDSYTFSFNDTGSFVNDSTEDISGPSRFANITKTINATRGKSVCGRFYLNDTWGNVNVTTDSCFTVANSAPQFSPALADQSVNSGQAFVYDINCTDIDGESITYSDNTPLFAIDPATGEISDNPEEADVAANSVTITCGDGTANTQQSFIYTVVDATSPSYTGLANNASTVTLTNGAVNWSVTLADGVGLKTYTFSFNDTGSFANDTAVTISGTSRFVNVTKTITSTAGKRVCGRLHFNDTSGNSNTTADSCFSVRVTAENSPPTTPAITHPANNTYITSLPVALNLTSGDADNDSITYYHFINGTLNATTTDANATMNASDGFYAYAAYASDGMNNSANSTAVYFTIDATKPQISYGASTDASGTSVRRNWVFANVTASDANEANITFRLYNETGLHTSATYTNGIRNYNFTSLRDSMYFFNVTITDAAGNSNATATRNVTVDTSAPSLGNITAIEATNSTMVIYWTTNENSNSTVEYGANASYGTAINNASNVTKHLVFIGGLSQGTTMHYRVSSSDPVLNENTSGDHVFTVPKKVDSTASITANQSTQVNASGVKVLVSIIARASITGATINITAGAETTANRTFAGLNVTAMRYARISAGPEILANVTNVYIRFDYNETELADSNISEDTLAIYRHNGSKDQWEKLNSTAMGLALDAGVNTTLNYVYANTTNLSDYATGGLLANGKPCSSNSTCGSGNCAQGFSSPNKWCAPASGCADDGTEYANASKACSGSNLQTCSSGAWTSSSCSNGCSGGACISSGQQTSTGGAAGGGGGGGGGGGALKKILDELTAKKTGIKAVTLDTNKLNYEITAGEGATAVLTIKNDGETDTELSIEAKGKAEQFIKVQEVLRIKAGKTEKLQVNFFVPAGTKEGVYDGEIAISIGGEKTTLPVSIKVNAPTEKEKLLDVRVTPLDTLLGPGEELKLRIDIYNLGQRSGRFDVQLLLELISSEKNATIDRQEEAIAVETSTSIIRSFEIPKEAGLGKYLVKATATYTDKKETQIATAIAQVRVQKPLIEILKPYLFKRLWRVRVWQLMIMAAVAAVILESTVKYNAAKIRRRRYAVAVNEKKLPKRGPRAELVGRIAETKTAAYLGIDNLTTHTIVAGATGSGKTIAAQDIIEEALEKGTAVVVFDPAAQWTGFLRKCENKAMLAKYPGFGMSLKQARAYAGNIREVNEAREIIKVNEFIEPGKITILALNRLTPKDIDVLIANTIRTLFLANLEESPKLKLLLVFDEVHRLLTKFGGSGDGLVQLERAAREFRKWGIGLVLISQVLTDFVGEVKANIATQIQMRTSDEGDLERLREKYGESVSMSIVRASVGTGMVENAEYNEGRAYFVSFRPIKHSVTRMTDDELQSYRKFNDRIDEIESQISQLKELKADVFDLEIELKLSKEKLSSGNFTMVQVYLDSLEPRIRKLWEKLKKKPKSRQKNLSSMEEIKADIKKARAEREKIAKDEKEKEPTPAGAKKKALESGNLYIINEKDSSTAFQLAKKNIEQYGKGLCLTRIGKAAAQKYGLKNTEIKKISTEPEEGAYKPTDISAMHSEIREFTKNNSKGVVLVDGVILVINHAGFEKAYDFLQTIKELVENSQFACVAPINLQSVTKEQKTKLTENFKVL